MAQTQVWRTTQEDSVWRPKMGKMTCSNCKQAFFKEDFAWHSFECRASEKRAATTETKKVIYVGLKPSGRQLVGCSAARGSRQRRAWADSTPEENGWAFRHWKYGPDGTRLYAKDHGRKAWKLWKGGPRGSEP